MQLSQSLLFILYFLLFDKCVIDCYIISIESLLLLFTIENNEKKLLYALNAIDKHTICESKRKDVDEQILISRIDQTILIYLIVDKYSVFKSIWNQSTLLYVWQYLYNISIINLIAKNIESQEIYVALTQTLSNLRFWIIRISTQIFFLSIISTNKTTTRCCNCCYLLFLSLLLSLSLSLL